MGQPRGLYVLFFTEMWERFSYYGMRALLVFFMAAAVEKGGLGFSDATATAIYGLYTAMVFLVALPGGWIGDHLLGAQRTVWIGGLVIAAGHFVLAIPSKQAFFPGLLLVILGTGLLKPNIAAIVGELYPQGGAQRDAGFTIFYMGINLGAAIGPLICSYLGEQVNWHYGFAAAGVGMVLGLTQYRLTRRYLGNAGLPPRRQEATARGGMNKKWYSVAAGLGVAGLIAALGFSGVVRFDPVAIAQWAKYLIVSLGIVYFTAVSLFGGLTPAEKRRMVVLAILMLGAAMFWAGFEQAGSSLNLFALDHTRRKFAGLPQEIPAGWFQSLNPIFILIFAPVMASLWVSLGQRNKNPSIPAKFALGLILLGGGFLVMAAAAMLLGPGRQVLPTWLIATYLIHTIGELCLSPVGLAAVTRMAPRRFVGQMMGMWYMSASLGSLTAGLIAGAFAARGVEQMPAMYLKLFLTIAGAGVVLLAFTGLLKRMIGDIGNRE